MTPSPPSRGSPLEPRSWALAMRVVSSTPTIRSGTSSPSSVTASVYMWIETLRTDIRLVALSVRSSPLTSRYVLSELIRFRLPREP